MSTSPSVGAGVPPAFASRVVSAMMGLGLSPAALARQLGVDRSYVTRWLKGERHWDVSLVSAAEAILRIDLADAKALASAPNVARVLRRQQNAELLAENDALHADVERLTRLLAISEERRALVVSILRRACEDLEAVDKEFAARLAPSAVVSHEQG